MVFHLFRKIVHHSHGDFLEYEYHTRLSLLQYVRNCLSVVVLGSFGTVVEIAHGETCSIVYYTGICFILFFLICWWVQQRAMDLLLDCVPLPLEQQGGRGEEALACPTTGAAGVSGGLLAFPSPHRSRGLCHICHLSLIHI